MVRKSKATTAKKKGRVKVGKLIATKELSGNDAKKIKGGIITHWTATTGKT